MSEADHYNLVWQYEDIWPDMGWHGLTWADMGWYRLAWADIQNSVSQQDDTQMNLFQLGLSPTTQKCAPTIKRTWVWGPWSPPGKGINTTSMANTFYIAIQPLLHSQELLNWWKQAKNALQQSIDHESGDHEGLKEKGNSTTNMANTFYIAIQSLLHSQELLNCWKQAKNAKKPHS